VIPLNYYEIGQRIRKYRKAQQLSQEELAEKIGISTTHMSHIETGNTKLSLPVLVALASQLDVRTDDLLFECPKGGRLAEAEELLSTFDGCSSQQIKVLSDILKAAKLSMNKHL